VLQLKCNVLIHTALLIFVYMYSVFNESPPSFSIPEISDILDKEYSTHGTVTELYSDRDQNFHVSNGVDEFIIKVSNPAEERSQLDLQEFASKYISRNDPTIKIPKLAGKIFELRRGGKTYLIRLMTYVKGEFLFQANPHTSGSSRLGKFLGRLSRSLEGFDHADAHRKFEWDCRQTDLIYGISEHIVSNKDRNIVDHFLGQFEKSMPALINGLRMSVIHNDGNDHNILVDQEDDIIGIIDFGDMVYTFQSVEPAVGMAYIALKHNDPFKAIASMLKNYHSIFPLQENELASTIYLMCSRLCITVCMSAWRKKLFPNNQYLIISEISAWELLKMMKKEDLDEWSNRLVKYAS